MPLHLWTARMPCLSRGFGGYEGTDRLDVSRGTSDFGSAFAPSRALQSEYERLKRDLGRSEQLLGVAWAWFTAAYAAEMHASQREQRPAWEALLSGEEATLCCYCGTAGRCHRRVLARMLVRLGAVDHGERATVAIEPARAAVCKP